MSGQRPSGEDLLVALERGEARAAEPDGAGGWRVNAWVKEGILDLFRSSDIVDMGVEFLRAGGGGAYRDKAAFPVRRFAADDGVRLVPGGTAVRRGTFLAQGVVLMPPAYVNVGAYVGDGSMIDSHALVGSCAQVGARVHVSAAAQIGGVLEPAGARPVIVEDDAFVGGQVGLYDGVRIGPAAVLAAGVILTGRSRLYDLVEGRELIGTDEAPLEVPAGAVVVPGTRPAAGDFAAERGLQVSCAMIVKRRDAGTDAATALEGALR